MMYYGSAMEQQIRFCTSADGARIAFSTVGNGPLLIYVAPWLSHLEHDWKDPDKRAHFEALARHHTLVRYDKHGCGLSDRNRTDLSLDAEVRILESLIEHLGIEQLALLGISQAGPVAVAYAVKHSQRVSQVILYGTYARGADIATDEFKASLLSLIRAHWGVGSKTLADLFVPDTDAAALESFARFQRESATAEMAAQLLALTYEIDVSDLLPKVTAPTVVIHRERDRAMPFRLGREVASLLPHARLVPLEGRVHPPWLGDWEAVIRAIAAFLGDPVEESVGRAPVTVLFTDMESSTAITQRLGDASAQEVRRAHNEIVRTALAANGGSEVKHTGDGIMASFTAASSALNCAIAIQRGVAAHKEQQPDSPLGVYVGLNAGEPIAEDDDLFGTSINLAARVCDHAEPGQIVAADVVRQLAAGKDFLFADLGDTELRGFEDPVKLWEVRWRENG